jgi:hypothetical protein
MKHGSNYGGGGNNNKKKKIRVSINESREAPSAWMDVVMKINRAKCVVPLSYKILCGHVLIAWNIL